MRLRLETVLTGVAVCAIAGAMLWPHARDASAVLAAQDDPVALADAQIEVAVRHDNGIFVRSIEQALAAKDADLAQSFVDLAAAKHVGLPDDLRKRVSDAVADFNSAPQIAIRFATGLVTGTADDVASMAGTVAGDLFVFGDIRDAAREGKHLVMGEDVDRVILGLAAAGLAITAATYISVGGAAPVRTGLTLVKDARKVGRIGEGLTAWVGRSAREVVDAPMLRTALADASVMRPAQTVDAVKAAFRADKAGGLVRLAKDVGRVGEKAGAKGAMDALRIAEGPKDVARAAKLAESKGGQTRAIMKMFGRGALLLAAGAFNLTLWVFWALLALTGFLSTIKATTERMTWSHLQRKKAKRLRDEQQQLMRVRHDMALRTALAGGGVQV